MLTKFGTSCAKATSTRRFASFAGGTTTAIFTEKLLSLMVEELGLESSEDVMGFECSVGAEPHDGRVYFWRKRGDNPGAAEHAEDLADRLSPVRGNPHGTRDLNRFIQRRFRDETREWATTRVSVQ